MRHSGAIAALLVLSCQKAPESLPPSEPSPATPAAEPTPAPEPTAAAEPVVDAGTPTEADAAPPPAPACSPVAKAPTIDVFLRFSTGSASMGPSMPAVATLVAKVSAPSVKLGHEIWSSPAPTSCSAQAAGDAMSVSCITDEGQLHGRVFVAGEELVVEVTRGLPPLPVGAGADKLRYERETSVQVPCGSRLRVHAAARDYH